jgi:hypothetical protein
MNAHRDFDLSFMAARVRPLFERVESTAGAGANEAVNYPAMSARVKRMYAAAAIQRIDMLTAAIQELAARRAELVELTEEMAAEVAA